MAADDTRRTRWTRRPGRWSVWVRMVLRLLLPVLTVTSLAAGCATGEGTGDEDPDRSAVSVVAVIDGDTIDVSGGERVRLIGIDTPEVGQCGYDGATAALRQLVAGAQVSLVPGAGEDRDRYGRLLRYVESDGVDVNLMMLLSGRAVARYDSRDGYGRHPREDAYVAADLANPSANVCGGPARTTTLAPEVPSGTDPRFGSCREATSNGYGPYVTGQDPEYGWYSDGDGDGVSCE